ncbi:hypothetical protein EHQ24_08115 [Leptospira noumeaensis]|uniref:DUF4145 domain-containing protein n=1 Tax=Leptospira noumeaensis TaxID=2484964 RepID=A0A4V3JK15_9LEPT|nr:hypothetical protein [Leptospira noumeaensis]TGK82978.1 hypothetical protein EHQ24_08115 [Leptospira noumeaensis]
MKKEKILNRISELKNIEFAKQSLLKNAEELFAGTLSIATVVYGRNSTQVAYLIDMRNKVANSKYDENSKYSVLFQSTLGYITNLEKEINDEMILSLEIKISGELFSDFIYMAKESMETGHKDVAVVLASASLEDSLKKLAEYKNINVEGKEMSDIVNILKSNEVLSGPQLKVIQSFVKIRNKAFHAEWNKIDTPEVKSLIAFLDEFIIKNFSQ